MMTDADTDTTDLADLLETAYAELVAALSAVEEVASGTRTAGYIPDDALDELAATLAVVEDISIDAALLLSEPEKARLVEAIDRSASVLNAMNRDPWARGGAVGLHYEYLKVAVDALEAIPPRIEQLQDRSLLIRDEASERQEVVRVFELATEALLQVIGSDPNDWREFGPRRFEEILAEIWSGLGWQTVLTPPTKDGGFDIRAVRDENGMCVCYLVEAKAYRPDRPVGIGAVRHLYGVVERERASHGVIATTSTFTGGALAEAAALRYRLTLADFQRVLDWVRQYRQLKAR